MGSRRCYCYLNGQCFNVLTREIANATKWLMLSINFIGFMPLLTSKPKQKKNWNLSQVRKNRQLLIVTHNPPSKELVIFMLSTGKKGLGALAHALS